MQFVGLIIIVWAATSGASEPMSRDSKLLLVVATGVVMVIVVNVAPWRALLETHGIAPPAWSARIAPSSLAMLPDIIPPIAVFCGLTSLRAYRTDWLVAALLGSAIAGIVVAAFQVAAASDLPAYPYGQFNVSAGTGFFADAGPMAALLLAAMPFTAAISGAARENVRNYSLLLVLLSCVMMVLLIGLWLTGSRPGYALSVPVLCASALLMTSPKSGWRRLFVFVGMWSTAAWVAALAMNAGGATKIGGISIPFVGERLDVLGVLFLIFAFLVWWASAVWDVWHGRRGGPFARAASIASAAVLVQSIVAFPLATPAISATFAMCIALLADRRLLRHRQEDDLRPTRHLFIG